ncbi:V-type proton ATPase subunit F [Strongyloides ratti]|uniref:V-type proton ATPase subunit F n=1 Tax=Strongyloides ratti TaxID=34506 RepID=A0A090MX72_STRRB|nr:V-type proton ATPase subunit F [Strongyloides ratti]CEF64929.1 V-type proton ATPase subunit F [Strongyloides ratti]
MLNVNQKDRILAVIGDTDTVVGFLLGGIGELKKTKEENYFIVERDTPLTAIEEAFNSFVNRDDIAIILINQHIAELIRNAIDNYRKSIPAILEIPSKGIPYDPNKDSVLNRARGLFNAEDFI